ncbi:unnamed protein product [Owenia fusiformis]|uniref:Uncharacterized protein n=1 Tax=Owenia fusiformis TaxID=6347 RepID=A0A8J1URW7_OWEFU|nr:unnamed protein product [Owenia fusiformis]
MVKTRHSIGIDEEAVSAFDTIGSRSSRRRAKTDRDINEYVSDASGPIEENPPLRSMRRRAQQSHVKEEHVHNASPGSVKVETRRITRRSKGVEEPVCLDDAEEYVDEEVVLSPQRKRVKRRRSSNERHDSYIRRSGRQRKLQYESFNTTLIEHQQMVTGINSRTDSPRKLKRRLEDEAEQGEGEEEEEEKEPSMYTRVKRVRKQVKRDMYGVPITENSTEEDSDDSETEESSSSSEEEEEQDQGKKYNLRESRQKTQHFEIPIEPQRPRMRSNTIFGRSSTPPLRRRRTQQIAHQSPALRSPFKRRKKKRTTFHSHGSDSTSSSSSSSSPGNSSDDERRFEKRKSKSMAKSRQRCLPMNFDKDDLTQTTLRDRAKIGASMADIDPMNVDRSVDFASVGGLGKHIRSLKEMIVFPLLYPEVFERFKIAPPRGVLFYGPPGTGKTLVARALANECSTGNRKVAFFMRKGADCLSKWVGESERQLRLLFDQAYQVRPSIIFFDEIDGLAPVRSSRQDQIHSSIVSTLLALMDGLDSRGEIVVIGATNRIDSIDPALRRPGRFDREFLFPLPSLEARKQILQIHTKEWNPKLSDCFLSEVAERTVGYCGADIKSLCTESALHALRRRYPQIYTSNEKLQLDVTSIDLTAKDFHTSMLNIVPTAQRSVTSPARALSVTIEPLLRVTFNKTMESLRRMFPPALAKLASLDTPAPSGSKDGEGDAANNSSSGSEDDEDAPSIYDASTQGKGRKRRITNELTAGPFLDFTKAAYSTPTTYRPRLLCTGLPGQGQSSHLAPAILHQFERLPVHILDLPSLYANSAKTPEEACAHIFQEAKRTSPSIIYLPHVNQWWDIIPETLKATFLALLQDLNPSCPILLLATSEELFQHLPHQIQLLFSVNSGEVIHMYNPNADERRAFFQDLLLNQACKTPKRKLRKTSSLEVLPLAPPPEPRKLSEREMKRLHNQEEATLRELRLFIRDVINKLARDRRFNIFAKPVDPEEVDDYYDVIKTPMDLSTMMSKIDLHKYQTVKDFLDDIDLIRSNALEYNPDRHPEDKAVRHRACALRDLAHSIVDADLDRDFERQCEEIAESREKRGPSLPETAPAFYHVKPIQNPQASQAPKPPPTIPQPDRFSRRTRGLNAIQEAQETTPSTSTGGATTSHQRSHPASAPVIRSRIHTPGKTPLTIPKPKKQKKCIWASSSRRNKRRTHWASRFWAKRRAEMAENEPEVDQGIEIDDGMDIDEQDETKDLNTTEEIVILDNDLNETIKTAGTSETTADVLKPLQIDTSNKATDIKESALNSPSTRSKGLSPVALSPNTRSRAKSPIAQSQGCKSPGGHSPITKSPRSLRAKSPIGSQRVQTIIESDLLIKDSEDSNDTKASSGTTISRDDSGICSAQESNGEVLEKPNEPQEEVKQKEAEVDVVMATPQTHETPKKNNEVTEVSSESKESTPAMRMTRGRLHQKEVEKAHERLYLPAQPFVIDRDRLRYILEQTVHITKDFIIEDLERVHSKYSQCIYQHRKAHDRTQLLVDLEEAMNMFAK